MKFAIAGKVYDVVDVKQLSMKDMLLFEQQTEAMGRRLTWADVTRWRNELEALPDDKARGEHPDSLWLTAVSVWAARRASGEDVTFEQAVDFPAADIKFIATPADRKPKKAAAGKAPARKATGQRAK